ncbi:hypothetical protein TWF694_000128 [Orbilia ellipsospora]|uniref:Uncharacterized protein n=1 Tax=Orbilia ellipsospora TaxID=2528407 RepID=A0AAV9XMQ7_9PEZI
MPYNLFSKDSSSSSSSSPCEMEPKKVSQTATGKVKLENKPPSCTPLHGSKERWVLQPVEASNQGEGDIFAFKVIAEK